MGNHNSKKAEQAPKIVVNNYNDNSRQKTCVADNSKKIDSKRYSVDDHSINKVVDDDNSINKVIQDDNSISKFLDSSNLWSDNSVDKFVDKSKDFSMVDSPITRYNRSFNPMDNSVDKFVDKSKDVSLHSSSGFGGYYSPISEGIDSFGKDRYMKQQESYYTSPLLFSSAPPRYSELEEKSELLFASEPVTKQIPSTFAPTKQQTKSIQIKPIVFSSLMSENEISEQKQSMKPPKTQQQQQQQQLTKITVKPIVFSSLFPENEVSNIPKQQQIQKQQSLKKKQGKKQSKVQELTPIKKIKQQKYQTKRSTSQQKTQKRVQQYF